MQLKTAFYRVLRNAGIGLVLILMLAFFALSADHFTSLNNIKNVFTQITINTILAVGMTYVILAGEIDLSVGAVMALAAVTAAKIMTHESFSTGQALLLGTLAALAIGMLAGFLNGYVTVRWKLPSFIVTLGILNIARGAALYITEARTIFGLPKPLTDFGGGTFLQDIFPYIFVVAIVLVVIGQFVLSRTVFGRHIFAIGNNEEAVRLSGHNPGRYKIIVFMIAGLTAGIAGVIYLARLTVATPNLGSGFELNAIAAVIIGGTSLSGGRGSVIGTLLGATLMGVLTNGLILMGVGDFVRQMVTGLIIVVAVIFDAYRAKFTLASPIAAEQGTD